MASGFFSILDDAAALMDDIAVASKVATRKTAAILGDDLAVNAERATGFLSERELPVLWAITKGSLLNKLIIVPIALVLTTFSPTAIKVILVLGGFYLAYEGAEKVVEYFFHRSGKHPGIVEQTKDVHDKSEKMKIKSAIATDFILSVEIVIIALGTVLEKSLMIQIITVSIVSLLATVGVYGLVALIVRMDDIGYNLIKRSAPDRMGAKFGHLLVKSLPVVIKVFSFVGTIALLLVAGGIFIHNIVYLHHGFPQVPMILKELAIGLAGGVLMIPLVNVAKKVFRSKDKTVTKA